MIKYDDKLNRRISNITKTFNRKIANLRSKGVTNLPEPTTVANLKSEYYNRKDLETKLNEMQMFNQRGSEKLKRVGNRWFSQFEIDLFKNRVKTEKSMINKEIAVSYVSDKDEYSVQLVNRAITLSKPWQELITSKRVYSSIMQRRQNINTAMDSYLEALFTDLYTLDYPTSKIKEMEKKLKTLTPRQLQYMLENEPLAKVIFDYYHELTRDEEAKWDDVYEAINTFYEDLDRIISKYK